MVKLERKRRGTTAIHYIGYPCGIQHRNRHHSMMLSSNTNPDSVTCKGCIDVCKRIAQTWKHKL